MQFIIAAAIVLILLFYVIPQVIWPVVRQSMSEVPLQGDLMILGILAIGAAVMIAGIAGILGKRK